MTGWAAGVRLLQLAAGVQTLGGLAFLLLVGQPSRPGTPPVVGPALEARILGLVRGSAAVALLAALAALPVQAAVATGRPLPQVAPGDLWALLSGTRYGHVWAARVGLLGLLAVLLGFRAREASPRDRWALRLEGTALASGALAGLAWAGHAVAVEGWEAWAITADALHLLATGVWAGGLLPLWLLLREARRTGAAALDAAGVAVERFSGLGVAAVATLLLTGTANAWFHVRGTPALLGTPYGRSVLGKLALLLPLLLLAARNRLALRPRLGARPTTGGAVPALAALQRSVGAEVILVSGLLVVAALLTSLPPGRHLVPEWPLPWRLAWAVVGEVPGIRPRVAVGTQLATLGLVAVLLALVGRPRRWRAVTAGGLLASAVGLGLALPPLAVPASPTTYRRPLTPYTAAAVARGLTMYGHHCTGCHDPGARVQESASPTLGRSPADLTRTPPGGRTAGDLYWAITHGRPGAGMPPFQARLDEEARWDLVHALRALRAAARARPLGPTVTPRPEIPAPDIVFTPGVGDERSLRELATGGPTLVVLFRLPESARRLEELAAAYPALRRLGAELLAVPTGPAGDVYRALGGRAAFLPIAVEGAEEAARAYALFHPDPVPGGPPTPAAVDHLELLLDRHGSLRARWHPGQRGGWGDVSRLLAEVERLAREALPRLALDEHMH